MKYLQIDSVIKPAFAAVLSVLALAGCQKNGFETVYAGGDSIVRFAPSVAVTESTTKGALLNEDGTASAFPTGKTFKVSAWTGTTKSFGYDDVAYKTGGASGSYWITVYGSGPNQGKDKEYLWKQGETKSVFAYANLPTTNGAAGIENSSSASQVLTYDVSKVATDDLQTDILMAYYTNGTTPKTDGLVPLTFYHPLTAVKFVQGTIAEGLSIKSVSIEGVYPSGKTAQSSASSAFSWTRTDGASFTKADETQTVSLSSVAVDPDTKQIGTALLLIPQAFSSSSKTRIKVVLKDAADDSKTVALYYPLNTNLGTESSPVYTSWSAGYTNTYKINFNGIVAVDRPEMYNGSPLEETVLPPDIIPGPFSVDEDKYVYFTKGNLYWDGDSYEFEAHQYDYPTTWDLNHVGHFFFVQDASKARAVSYEWISMETDDFLFTNEDENTAKSNFKVGTETGKYRSLYGEEWNYLLYERENAEDKFGYATVGGVRGLIILPDEFTDPNTNNGGSAFVPQITSWTANLYTSGANWDAMESAGAVFLPQADYRQGNVIKTTYVEGNYWTSSSSGDLVGSQFMFELSNSPGMGDFSVDNGLTVRLVMDAEE